jgi:UDP-glucose 4-epimerase
MNKILITGVAGMIGSHLSEELLINGYEVVGYDNLSFGKLENLSIALNHSKFSMNIGDVLDIESLDKLCEDKVAVIVHLAAYKKIGEKDNADLLFSTNGIGTRNVLECARKYGIRVILASTSDVYGMSEDLPLKESNNLVLGHSGIKRWSYAVSKLYNEHLAMCYHKDFGVPLTIVRYFGGFSSRSSFSWSGGHIPLFIKAILSNEEVIIHGDGSQTRSMGYVSDLVNGTILCIKSSNVNGEIINIGNDEEYSVIDTAKLIHELAQSENQLKVKFIQMESIFGDYKDITRRIPDLNKAFNLLGFKPQTSFEVALKLVIEEMRKS